MPNPHPNPSPNIPPSDQELLIALQIIQSLLEDNVMANLQDLINAQTQTIQSVNDLVTKLGTYETAVQTAFNHLEQLIAAGSPVPQSALDALNTLGTSISSQSSTLDTAIAAAQTEATK